MPQKRGRSLIFIPSRKLRVYIRPSSVFILFGNKPFRSTLRDVKQRGLSPWPKSVVIEEQDLQELIKACRKGNRKSQDKLYKQFYGFAMGVCLRYSRSRDEAIEILNDGFYKIMTNLDKYTPGLSFKGWLRKIMINASIDHYRRNEKHYDNVDISYVKNEHLSADVLSYLSEEVILKAIQELPPSYRLVFNLYCMEGFKHSEISQKLNISEGTSKSNLNTARIKLKKALSLEFDFNAEQNG